MKKNFNNQNFEWLFQDITSSMPKIIFTGIILTYLITAALNVYFLPLPLLLSIPASLMLQFGRFAVVFIDFLNPSDKRSKYPPRVAANDVAEAIERFKELRIETCAKELTIVPEDEMYKRREELFRKE